MVKYKNKNRTIVYSRGMTNDDAIKEIEKRMGNREKEIYKREWIVKEYNSLIQKQEIDREWLLALKNNEVVLGDKNE